ncbi:MAG TPA: DUF4215 domain-containing protein [Candidatus Acidoferrales bacterium]|nr:DUF4215 domain-containing protein [Candidatus Acidoferrales bacterium]
MRQIRCNAVARRVVTPRKFTWAVSATILLALALAAPTRALQMGTVNFSVVLTGLGPSDTWCMQGTYGNSSVDVFGNSVNLGAQAAGMVCNGSGATTTVQCVSYPSGGVFDFQGTIAVLFDSPSTASFIIDQTTATGTIPQSVGSTVGYTFDGRAAGSGPPPGGMPGCNIVPANLYATGTGAINAFQSVATPTGADVAVASTATYFNPISGQSVDVPVSINFNAIGEPGDTTVTATSNSSAILASNFQASVDGFQAAFLDIRTTAAVTPPITICTDYPDADDDGFIDGTSVPETSLRFLHGEGNPLTFVDRTVSQDVSANQICAQVDSLSPFVTVVSKCGNGQLDGSETCDDGNGASGDGCSSSCQVEPGYACDTPGSACTFVCGNSTVNSSETCDDGNTTAGDGCSATCQLESGWQCSTPGQPCTFVCGNGQVDASEECDDGGVVPGDGCSPTCKIEACHQCSGQPSACTPQTGTSCDDGDRCTTADTCNNGTCAGTAVQCHAAGQCFDVGTCNPLNGVCSNPLRANGSSCDSGDGCVSGDACQSGQCQAMVCPSVDAEIAAGKPVNVTIGNKATSVIKKVSVTVRNADSVDRTIALDVSSSDCPAGIASLPDFDTSTTSADTSAVIKAGKTKKAQIALAIYPADFTSFNYKAPKRCTLTVTAATVIPDGSNDSTPSNNVALLELNVVDKHDAEQTSVHETTVASAPPVVFTIPSGKSTLVKTLTAKIGNADYRPTAESPGDDISLSASSSCAGLRLATPICTKSTSSDDAIVKGAKTASCKISATADSATISTPNKLSPRRCTVTLTAAGPSDPEMAPLDPSNNVTNLVVDVLDKHDY